MYIPEIYKEADEEKIIAFIKSHVFATLCSNSSGKLWATHLPLIYIPQSESKGKLIGHISKANQQRISIENEEELLAIFLGDNSYISSSWYENEEVSTWNYMAVHIYGRARMLNESDLTYLLQDLTFMHEKNQRNPRFMEDLSQEILSQKKGIVGFEIAISEIQGSFKLSQNRNDKDYNNIVAELEKLNEHRELVSQMKLKKES